MAQFDDNRLKNTGSQRPLSGGPARNNRSSVTGRRIHEAKSSGPSVGLVALILACVVAVVVTVAIVNRQPATTNTTSEAAKNETTGEQKNTEGGTSSDTTKEEAKDEAQKKETTTTETKPVSAGDTAATPNKTEESAETAKIGNDYNADKKEGENAEGEASKDAESQSGSEGNEGETQDAEATTGTGSSSSSSSKAQTGDWIEAEACASSAAETGSSPTASGIDFDDSSPQVALQRTSDSASHFGEYVEVKYGDQTVTAQVVDHGGLHSGENGILLNPSVFEVFGATSSDDWGRRDVTYRFV